MEPRLFKVQMKCFFLLLNLKEQQKSGRRRLPFLHISSTSRVKGLKVSSFRSKSARKCCRNQSKSIKFVTSYAGHVDGMKK